MVKFCLVVASYLLLGVSLWGISGEDISTNYAQFQNRIVGGQRVTNRERFPYQVSLRREGQHICGATIYKQQYVITAGHCVLDAKPSQLKIVAGNLNLKQRTEKTQTMKVANIIIHENYSDFVNNDVAVLKLQKNFTFNNHVNSIRVLNPSSNQCVISGWGTAVSGGTILTDLHSANISILDQSVCLAVYGDSFIPVQMLCAGDLNTPHDACNGDSGGPLVCDGSLYGIVSWGYDCGLPQFPGVYTNASHYAKWIDANTNTASTTYNSCIILFICLLLAIK